MRKLFYIKTFLLISLILVSCGAPQRIIVSGKPGTSIYTPHKLELAKIGEDGKVKMEIDGNIYYPFLLSKEADSDTENELEAITGERGGGLERCGSERY